MENNKRTIKLAANSLILSLCAITIWLVICPPAAAQSAGEAITTMGIQQELMGSQMQQRIKEPNLNTESELEKETTQSTSTEKNANALKANSQKSVVEQQVTEKLKKTAEKLMQSLQSGKYDQADFSAVWNTVIPKDTNFNEGMNALIKPVFEMFGKAEKLGEGKMAGVNRAVFPVQFTKGTLNMTVSLDPQEKIVEWTLLAQTAEATAQKELNAPEAADFNDYKQEITRIDIEARDEESKWLGRLERKAELAKAMNDVVVAELKFLRKSAEAEGAQKTVEAIDLLLKKRQDRLTKLTTKLEDEAKTERRERRTPRLGGAGGVGVSEQGQTPRPQRRAREPIQPTNTNNEGQQP